MSKEDKRPMCKYGVECYQKNPEHHSKFQHPKRPSSEPEADCKRAKVDNGDEKAIETTDDGFNAQIDATQFPDRKELLKQVYDLDFPEDLFYFHDFCKSEKSDYPLKALSSIGLRLVGPFDFLEKRIDKCSRSQAFLHWRHFFDPPEFMTILQEEKSNVHYGYFRDSPTELPIMVASNDGEGPIITPVAGTIFGAVNNHIEKIKKTIDPFSKMKIQKLQNSLKNFATEKKITLDSLTSQMRARRAKVVSKTFNQIGIVVPVDKKTDLGYRNLAATDKEIKDALKSIVEGDDHEKGKAWGVLQPVITFANIANDEYDFGTGLELGIDLFSDGHDVFHKICLQQLRASYSLLNRDLYGDIAEAHLANRKKGKDILKLVD